MFNKRNNIQNIVINQTSTANGKLASTLRSYIMPLYRKSALSLALLTALTGITLSSHAHDGAHAAATSVSKTSSHVETLKDASSLANQLFDEIFMAEVLANPVEQTFLGIKQDYDKWNDISDAAEDKRMLRIKDHLAKLAKIDQHKLDAQTRLSYELLEADLKQTLAQDKWRHHSYPVNQMYGQHAMLASLLINQHQIADISDANAYISRLNGIPAMLAQLEINLEIRAKKNIIAPKFVFPYAISDSNNIIKGAPFDNSDKSSAIWADFNRKIDALTLTPEQKKQLLTQAKSALTDKVKPAYEHFISYIKTLEARADNRDGVWKLPDGEAFYNDALAKTTTTEMTSTQIHQLGVAEVERIHAAMEVIKNKVNFKGSLQEFFVFMRDDPQFYYPDTPEGRTAYLAEARTVINTMHSRLDEVFNIQPKAELKVKKVEAFREQSAGKAFYEAPAPDGSRPGTYYANLYDMKSMPKYQLEALAYHEGIPGHHMQIAIAQELTNVPKFRKFGSYTAYVEGWGLYTEYFPKEMGFYADPYSDFGRLSMELWRACRLVVDTGIHSQKWTREQAIAYYMDNTPNAELDAIKMVERHIVMPSQATAYKIGMIKILELREKAQQQLGDQFSLGQFHTLLLKNGPLPLTVLEQQVEEWIKAKSI
jgi:uncharacterized protein (DUF885 family)